MNNSLPKCLQITRLILCVISLFVICWLPNHTVNLIKAVKKTDDLEGLKVRQILCFDSNHKKCMRKICADFSAVI